MGRAACPPATYSRPGQRPETPPHRLLRRIGWIAECRQHPRMVKCVHGRACETDNSTFRCGYSVLRRHGDFGVGRPSRR